MKKLISILMALMLVFGLCACGGENVEGGNETESNVLQAGFARMNCIPDDKLVHIAGDDAANDPATDGLLDNLAITCVALKKGEDTYLIYTCDIVDIMDFYKETESTVSAATGVPVSNIILNATHTHSAPTLKPSDTKLPGRNNYERKFIKVSAEVAAAAIADLSPVSKLSYGSIQTENMVRVRHYLMNDGTSYGSGHGSTVSGYKDHLYPADEECQVIRISLEAEDKKDIVMMNLGAHATIVSGTHTSALSADFPFPARQYVEENADVRCAYFIAAGGDQTPSSKIPGEVTNKADHFAYGKQLGGYVVECLKNMTDSTIDGISYYNESYTADRMKDGVDDPDLMAKAKEIMELKKQYGSNSAPAVKEKCNEYGLTYYGASALVSRESAPDTGSFPIGTMLLGDIGIVFFPGEMFGSQGKTLKEESPTPFTFVITCSEEDQGYFPNAIAKEEGFYEYNTTKYVMGTGEAVAKRYCEILGALKNGTQVPAQTVN